MAKSKKYDALKLENQISFPLYASAKEIVRLSTAHLSELGLTYTQYIAMCALWEHEELAVNELGALVRLDSGTLTPLLKKLEAKGFVTRKRSAADERKVIVAATEAGMGLRDAALKAQKAIDAELDLDPEDAKLLDMTLNWLLESLSPQDDEVE